MSTTPSTDSGTPDAPGGVVQRLRGRFVVFDGVDGAGKSAQIHQLTAALDACGIEFVTTRDPGGTAIGDRIRHVLLDYDLSAMDVRCEALLFMASRAQLIREVVEPALSAGKTVVCDRFVSATCAYQGAAGLDPKRVIELARFAVGDRWPDLTFVIDLPADVGRQRLGHPPRPERRPDAVGQTRLFHDAHADAMESRPLEFHRRVRDIFLTLPQIYPAPVAVIDGTGSVEDVHARVLEAVALAVF